MGQQKEVKKKNISSEEEVLTDEHEKDFEQIERLTKKFAKEWESFFNGIWEEVKQSNAETIESNIKKAWQKQDKRFYINYIKKAYDLGEKRAQSIIEEVFTDDENIHIRIGIEKQDIAEELLNNSLLRVSKMQQTTIEEIRKILAEGYEQGESWKEQKKRIENKIKNPVRAEMIAITELGHAYNESTKNTYRGAGANKVVWHASLDLKTCDGCRSLHGQEFDIDKAPDNPLHPRCRCTWLPVFSERKSRSLQSGGRFERGSVNWLLDREEQSDKYYTEIRKRKDDIEKIAKNTGWSYESIHRIKNHVFIEKHIKDEGINFLDPDYDMSVAWQRLINGTFEERDILLLKHEYLESIVEKKYNITNREAHNIAEKKHDWRKEVIKVKGETGEDDCLDKIIREER